MYHGERFNSITHLVGAVAAAAGMVALVVIAAGQDDLWRVVSFSVYGFTLLLLYTVSTLYHSLRGRAKDIFRMLDHNSIYLLIAGTYTPFTLVTLRGVWGWSLFGVIWGLAAFGVALDSLSKKGLRIIPLIIYLVMGWSCVIAIKPLLEVLPMHGFYWLLAGGLFYTVGIFFYALDEKFKHFHGIWHLFVLAGSISHYVTIFYYV